MLPDGRAAHSTPERGPHVTTMQDFEQGLPVVIEDELAPAEHAAAIARLNELLQNPEKYDPVISNCETFARRVIRGTGISWQIVLLGVAIYVGYRLIKSGAVKPG